MAKVVVVLQALIAKAAIKLGNNLHKAGLVMTVTIIVVVVRHAKHQLGGKQPRGNVGLAIVANWINLGIAQIFVLPIMYRIVLITKQSKSAPTIYPIFVKVLLTIKKELLLVLLPQRLLLIHVQAN